MRLSKIYCKHLCKFYNVPPVQLKYANNEKNQNIFMFSECIYLIGMMCFHPYTDYELEFCLFLGVNFLPGIFVMILPNNFFPLDFCSLFLVNY
jgi:hypothetical protein